MNVTKKHHYGLSAMVQLGLFYDKGPIQLRFISEKGKIPHAFLEQLILDLKKSGLVKSTRGARGGYQLAHPPQYISVNSVFSAIDPVGFEFSNDHSLSFFWLDFNQHINEFLDLTLQTLMDNANKEERVLTYTI